MTLLRKSISVITLTLSILALHTSRSEAQVLTRLDKRASVSLPKAMEPTDSDGSPMWFFDFDGSATVSGMVMVLDARKFDLDSATIARNYDESAFVQGLVDGIFGQVQGIEERSRKKVSGPHFKGYEIQYYNHNQTQQYPYVFMYVRIHFAGSMVYMLGTFANDDNKAIAIKEKFFNTFKLQY